MGNKGKGNKVKLSFSVWVILLVFATLAAYGIYTLGPVSVEKEPNDLSVLADSLNKSKALDSIVDIQPEQDINGKQSALPTALELLQSGDYSHLEELVLENYSELHSDELESLRSAMHIRASLLRRQEKQREANELLQTIASIFNDKDSWKLIGLDAAMQKDWLTSYKALLKASQLENDGLKLTELLNSLAHAANLHTSSLIEQNDLDSALQVAESLYFSHPAFPKFQYNYAQALIALGRLNEARTVLASLKSEPNFANQSKELLSNIDRIEEVSQQDYISSKLRESDTANVDAKDSSIRSINIPLNRYGTGFIANARINNRSVSLLLDTGASITALNNQTIQKLGLTEIGQTITLNTANGQTQSELYRAKTINLNGVTMQNIVVANINMPENPNFVGLLGTDILNSRNNGFSFVLDTSKPALIFTQTR